ncbi:MAG: YifB family Mg chelatase-like AAA ATPase [Clostridiales bacterium]|nr:YifB family Mg chelatase-like AAA ATPase [Clostridiales bacterium]
MIAKVKSCGLTGLDGYIVEVEVDISMGLPAFDIVGLPDAAVRESKERVRSAMKNSGFEPPIKRITVNLAPADKKKEGPAYDLPMTVGILRATEQLKAEDFDEYMFFGELSLDGTLRPVAGALPMVVCAKRSGIQKVILPKDNADEAAVVSGVEVYAAEHLYDIVRHLRGDARMSPRVVDVDALFDTGGSYPIDFSDVRGQRNVKRAMEVAVAGGHNIIMIGAPGSGKSMLARRLPTILPDLTFDEALEITTIHSVAGTLPRGASLLTARPFRSPHHSVSAAGLAGGGVIPRPGELSLAHNGVLFLDELPEFRRDALEVMRQPLEDGVVTISRVSGTLTYPSRTMFAASMNPCKCGYYGDAARECVCTPPQISKYVGKISGPLLDRIDIHVEVASVNYADLDGAAPAEGSADIRARVNKARKVQLARYAEAGIFSNSQLASADLRRYCVLGTEERALLKAAFHNLGLSARAHDRILKVARTIADLDGSERITTNHIAEAIQYRSLDRKYWQ